MFVLSLNVDIPRTAYALVITNASVFLAKNVDTGCVESLWFTFETIPYWSQAQELNVALERLEDSLQGRSLACPTVKANK